MDPSMERLVLYIAEVGRVDASHATYRHLWYRGLTKWVSPTEMSLSDLGAREANRLLYHSSRLGLGDYGSSWRQHR